MSAGAGQWRVLTTGKLVDGFEKDTVLANFASTFGVSEDKALGYLQQGKLIKKDLTETEALSYRDNLQQMGLVVDIHDEAANDPSVSAPAKKAPPALSLAPVQAPADTAEVPESSSAETAPVNSAGALSIAPVDGGQSGSSRSSFHCPRCDLGQEKSDQCTGCGVFFEKLKAQEDGLALTNRSASATSAKYIGDDEEGVPALALGSAVVVAVICAYLWKLIAMHFGVEMGIVAWAIGAAIGAAATCFDGRGVKMGVCCALLVAMSIFGGKFLYTSAFMNEAFAVFEDTVGEDWAEVVNTEIASEREAYSRVGGDERSIKQFMIDHEYTEATTVADVSADEYMVFRDEIEPWLTTNTDGDLAAADSDVPDLAAAMQEISTWSVVMDSLGFLDLLFLFLGMTTAFRLGQHGFSV
ncbi:MAG: hypothetical protein KTR33_00730 [Gammaproteobacteria bacterium]|nr:hypothetical protein [Gammaproteobacteria bacterium]